MAGEALHLLCWRVVAALLEGKAAENESLTEAAQSLLSSHDADQNPATVARKLVFFLGQEYRDVLIDPRKAGLNLFVASLDQDYGLGSDFLLRLIGSEYVAPLLLVLKGQSLSTDAVAKIIPALRGNIADPVTPDWHPFYTALDPVEARAAIASWKSDAAE